RTPATRRVPGVRTQAEPHEPQPQGHSMTRVAVLGTGSWGTAFSMVLADAGADVVLWGRRQEVVDAITSTHETPDSLPGIPLPETVAATSDAAEALRGAEVMVLAVPA